jgi:hypothetical protein
VALGKHEKSWHEVAFLSIYLLDIIRMKPEGVENATNYRFEERNLSTGDAERQSGKL